MIPKLLNEISIPTNSSAYGVDQKVAKTVVTTYGEMLPEGIDMLINALRFRKTDVFYDLGSGTGRICLQVYLTKHIRCTGIEYVIKRHKEAQRSYKLLGSPAELNFIRGDFLRKSWNDATHIYMCNLCYSDKMTEKILEKTKECPNLRTIIAIKNFEHPNFILKKTLNVKSSWSEYNQFFIYIKVKNK